MRSSETGIAEAFADAVESTETEDVSLLARPTTRRSDSGGIFVSSTGKVL